MTATGMACELEHALMSLKSPVGYCVDLCERETEEKPGVAAPGF